MARRDGMGAKKVEVSAVDKTYTLQIGDQHSLFVLELGFEQTTVPKDQISVAVFQGVSIITSGLVHIGAPTGVPALAYLESARYVPPISLSWTSREPDLPFSVVYEDIIKFDIFNLRFSEALGEIPSKALTCVYIAFFMEHLQCFKYAS